MKQGDTIAVTIAGQTVAQAVVREVGEGEVTLVVPGTIVRMATRTQLAPEEVLPESAPVPEPAVQHEILGIDRVDEVGAVVDQTNVSAPADTGTPEILAPPITDPGQVAATESAGVVQITEPVAPAIADNNNAPA